MNCIPVKRIICKGWKILQNILVIEIAFVKSDLNYICEIVKQDF